MILTQIKDVLSFLSVSVGIALGYAIVNAIYGSERNSIVALAIALLISHFRQIKLSQWIETIIEDQNLLRTSK